MIGPAVAAIGIALSMPRSQVREFTPQRAILKNEFIYETAPYPACHASTIVQTAKGTIIAAWFGGTREGHPDVCIYLSRFTNGSWGDPQKVAEGNGLPCYNPVLFQAKGRKLTLFYKIGSQPSKWRGFSKVSKDDGLTWSEQQALPAGILGPIKDKPIELPNGTILSPSSTEDHGWQVHFERTSDHGATWQSTGPIDDPDEVGPIQPTILRFQSGKLRALLRTMQNRIYQTDSEDDGKTWGPLTPTSLPNPNSGIDAVTLSDGRFLLVYNDSDSKRTPLNVAISPDGETWSQVLTLEDQKGEYSYPAVIQSSDGHVHIVYTWQRKRIRYVELDPSLLKTER